MTSVKIEISEQEYLIKISKNEYDISLIKNLIKHIKQISIQTSNQEIEDLKYSQLNYDSKFRFDDLKDK